MFIPFITNLIKVMFPESPKKNNLKKSYITNII